MPRRAGPARTRAAMGTPCERSGGASRRDPPCQGRPVDGSALCRPVGTSALASWTARRGVRAVASQGRWSKRRGWWGEAGTRNEVGGGLTLGFRRASRESAQARHHLRWRSPASATAHSQEMYSCRTMRHLQGGGVPVVLTPRNLKICWNKFTGGAWGHKRQDKL